MATPGKLGSAWPLRQAARLPGWYLEPARVVRHRGVQIDVGYDVGLAVSAAAYQQVELAAVVEPVEQERIELRRPAQAPRAVALDREARQRADLDVRAGVLHVLAQRERQVHRRGGVPRVDAGD